MDNNRDRGGHKNPLSFIPSDSDPEGIASLTLSLGYSAEAVTTELVRRCKIDKSTAQRIVDETCASLPGGHT